MNLRMNDPRGREFGSWKKRWCLKAPTQQAR